MCLMIDANAVSYVFGDNPTPAGEVFRGSVNNQRRKLVLGGKLENELNQIGRFLAWLSNAVTSGYVYRTCALCTNELTAELENAQVCTSDDPHVIALAQISRCRVLCTDDADLKDDFRQGNLIDNPRGHLYPLDSNDTLNAMTSLLVRWTRRCTGNACQVRPVAQCPHDS